mmetsp:Transcript_4566/g.4704  ORF Transcript_4566/g.4704 Transcript_4566/m.4704 type:complete len:418 (+) Transcript_4566:10038-11291(+)
MARKEKKDSLTKRLLISTSILAFIRIGALLPVPAIDHAQLTFYFQTHAVTGKFINIFANSNTFVIGLFSLNIFPYINASILMQVLVKVIPGLALIQREGTSGERKAITRLTRLITLGFATAQALSIVIYLKRILFYWDLFLAAEIILWLVTGTMIILWLCEIITQYGLGNGSSILIFTNIISSVPSLLKNFFLKASETLNLGSSIILVILFCVAFYCVIFLQETLCIIPLLSVKQLSKRNSLLYSKYTGIKANYLPLKINYGVLPIILTSTLFFLIIPKEFTNAMVTKPFWSPTKLSYAILYFYSLIWFNSRYITLVVDPTQLSKQLQKMAVVIPGIRTGCTTRYFLAEILNFITLMGSIVLTVLFFIPNIVQSIIDVSSFNNLGITSLLIVAGIILDLSREVKSISLSNTYTIDKS